METNIVVDIPPPIPYLTKFWFSSYGPKFCQPIKLQDSLKCNISRKLNGEVLFWLQINIDVFYKLILSFLECVTWHSHITQNKKFEYLCNISRKVWGMKLIFCLQINTIVFYELIVSLSVCIASMLKVPKTISLQYFKENVKDEVHFLPLDKRQRFLQIDTVI